ncbi:MAG: hypothetical protein K0R57_1614 [Paenibacillaceae bacterium]|nr:hypothetical protein [Paenibacillaceae bacterium]
MDLLLDTFKGRNWLEVDPIPLAVRLLLVVVLVLLNAFFVTAESAIVKIRSGRLHSLAEQGHMRARLAHAVITCSNTYLSACQLGITLSSLGLGFIGALSLSHLLEPALSVLPGATDSVIRYVSVVLSFLVVSVLLFTIGEQVPKAYSIRKSESAILWIALPLTYFYKLTLPLNWMLNRCSNWMMLSAGIKPETDRDFVHSEEELRLLMKESRNSGMLDKTEFALVDNILGFSDTTAREIMIPRTEIVCLYAGLSYQENMAIAISEMLTRYPVCDPDKDNMIGFLHIKDLLQGDAARSDIRSIIRPLMSVPESMPISVLLQLMQKQKTQIALLIDEYGGTSGLVTVEDILEEIVGEIQDEFDEERPGIEAADEKTYSVDGLLLIDEVNERLGLNIDSDDYDTIGGWLYSQLESPPGSSQMVRVGRYELSIEEMDHLRISRILIRSAGAEEQGETVA